MSMIKIENLTFSYPGSYDNLFENVSFQIDTDWKLGFIGRNGRGKTTLLNLLLGKYAYTGKITASVQFDYFPYPIQDKDKDVLDILSEIYPDAQDWEWIRELSYLDLDAEILYRPFKTLSNGEQTKVLLAALFLNQAHFLLIDEPTNHLDIKSRQTVAAYLKRKKGFILVSHDRAFLDGCIDHVLSINKANIEVQSGNFSSWHENFERQQTFELGQNERLKKQIDRLKQSAQRSMNWSDKTEAKKHDAEIVDKGFVGHKSAKMMKRAKSIQSRQNQALNQKEKLLKNTEDAQDLKIFPIPYRAETLASFSEIEVQYEDKTICRPVSFTIRRGQRIALNGENGSGKSSLLKILLGQNIKYAGSIAIGSGITVSYVSQDTSNLNGLLSEFAAEHAIDESLFKAILRKMGFERVQFQKDIAAFSEGQKKKVLIAKSLCEKAHLYIWDEPLNFIDVYSRIQIEKLILQFCPTMIFVEHDQTFQNKIATQTVTIEKRRS